MDLQCPTCGVRFEAVNANQRYCSQRCCWLAWRERHRVPFKPFPCQYCGVLVEDEARRKFCSARCSKRWLNDRRNPERLPRPCLGCGELFVPLTGRQRYCAPSCRPKGRDRVKVCQRCGAEYTGGGHKFCSPRCRGGHAERKPRAMRPCEACGAEMEARRKYCSRACRLEAMHPPTVVCPCGTVLSSGQRQKGFTTCWPCRKPKPREFPYRNIKTRVKARLVAREKGRCQDCRTTAEQVGAPLHAHHIVPQGLGGGSTLSNLKLLCPDCHLGSGYERNHSLLLMAGLVEPKKLHAA